MNLPDGILFFSSMQNRTILGKWVFSSTDLEICDNHRKSTEYAAWRTKEAGQARYAKHAQ